MMALASLAVQKANYAVKMYENVGFKTVDENDEEYIMVCDSLLSSSVRNVTISLTKEDSLWDKQRESDLGFL